MYFLALGILVGCSPRYAGTQSDTESDTEQQLDTASGVPDDTDSGDSADNVDTSADTAAADSADPCADVPVVTYESFGRGFMSGYCQTCHASTTENRYGAPESVTFDSVDDCWQWSDRILARATGKSPSMPPNGGVGDDDRILLEWWLTCADSGT